MAASRIRCLIFGQPWRACPRFSVPLPSPTPNPPDPIRSPTNAPCCLLFSRCPAPSLLQRPHCCLYMPAVCSIFHMPARAHKQAPPVNQANRACATTGERRAGLQGKRNQPRCQQSATLRVQPTIEASAASRAAPAQGRAGGTWSFSHSLLGCSSPLPMLARAHRFVPSLAVAGGWLPSGIASLPRRCTSPDTLPGADLRAEPACSAADCAPSCSASSAREGGS